MAQRLRHSSLILPLDEGVDNQAVDRHMLLWTEEGWSLQHFSTTADPRNHSFHFIWTRPH